MVAFAAIMQCQLNSFDGLIDVQHLAMLNTITVCPAEAEYLQFAVFIFSSGNSSNFCSANVEAYDDWHTGVIVV